MKVCLAAAECKSTDFHSREMWFINDPSLFRCNTIGTWQNFFIINPEGAESVPFFEVFKKVFWPCFLWGSGVADRRQG